VSTATSIDSVVVDANQEFLADIMELSRRSAAYRIASPGLTSLRAWKRRGSFAQAFEALKTSTSPQERGRQFQKLVALLAREEGWRVDEGVLGPGEEIDVVLNRDDSFYLLECRWKGEPVEPKEIRDFTGKLQKRSGVQGVFVSMSGYTQEARNEVEVVAGDSPIVLVGPGEVADLFIGALNFNGMLTEKKRSLVLHRKAPWR
jgi:hypothetical protein